MLQVEVYGARAASSRRDKIHSTIDRSTLIRIWQLQPQRKCIKRKQVKMASCRAHFLLVTIVLLFQSSRSTAQLANLVQMSVELPDTGGSSITAAYSPMNDLRTVTFKFAPCTGLQLHWHTGSEMLQPTLGTLTVGMANRTNIWSSYNVTVGQLLEIPAGNMHYLVNNGCQPAAASATFPLDANTTFLMPALASLPPQPAAMFATGAFPALKGTFPMAPDASCMRVCQSPASG